MIMKLLSSNARYLFSSRASTMHLEASLYPHLTTNPPPSGGELPVAHRSCLPCYRKAVAQGFHGSLAERAYKKIMTNTTKYETYL